MLGHSSGESSALVASKAISWKSPHELSEFISKLNKISSEISTAGKIKTGALLAIGLSSKQQISKHIKGMVQYAI